jgi:hypothetical protein
MERDEMKILFKPESFYRLEASIGDAEAGDSNGRFIEAGQPLTY